MTSQVKVTLRNPVDKSRLHAYYIDVQDHALAWAWVQALKSLLQSSCLLEKNFCFMGFPTTARDIPYLCEQVNRHIAVVNNNLPGYHIAEHFTPENVFATDHSPMGVNHELFNQLHNHFEVLQGTVNNLSAWYRGADYQTKYAIRQLNLICHEMENLILGLRKAATNFYWLRPSQITTWINAPRYPLQDQHREGFVTNGYDRVLGGVYMHWAQIGKTLMEVFRDEGAPELTAAVCEAITHLEYYSGEFDIEWGNNITLGGAHTWHNKTIGAFREWLIENGLDPRDPKLSLGYLPVGQVNLEQSFGTTDHAKIWSILGEHLDIYSIEVDGVQAVYDYCWNDSDYEQQQINLMRPGYDYQTRNTQ